MVGMTRTVFDPGTAAAGEFYRVLTASVVPRPIAWVSTLSTGGVANLAPYSFFTVSSAHPPVVQFTSVARKDTLRNVEATGEFVVNLATEAMLDEVNASSAPYEPGTDEFAVLGIAAEPSERVRPPRVADSPVAIECRLRQVIEVGTSFVVMGDVLAVAVRPEALADDGLPGFAALAPLSRLGRDEWGTAPPVRRITRPGRPG